MSDQLSKADISGYLAKIKKLISIGKYDFVARKKNLLALARYGLTVKDAKEEILALVVSDYYKGPKQDLDINKSEL